MKAVLPAAEPAVTHSGKNVVMTSLNVVITKI